MLTQRSRCASTLGWMMGSRWDSRRHKPVNFFESAVVQKHVCVDKQICHRYGDFLKNLKHFNIVLFTGFHFVQLNLPVASAILPGL